MGDSTVIVIAPEEVESQDVSRPLGLLRELLSSADKARRHFERIDVTFHGYDNDTRELFEIPEVRNFVYKLDEAFPFWFYFLTKRGTGLQVVILCFLPSYLTDEAKARIFPERLGPLLSERWFPSMNHVCAIVGMSESELESLTNRTISYFSQGKLAEN